jgi:hypothetical protein
MLGVICATALMMCSLSSCIFLTVSWYKKVFVNHHKTCNGVRFKDGWPHNWSLCWFADRKMYDSINCTLHSSNMCSSMFEHWCREGIWSTAKLLIKWDQYKSMCKTIGKNYIFQYYNLNRFRGQMVRKIDPKLNCCMHLPNSNFFISAPLVCIIPKCQLF